MSEAEIKRLEEELSKTKYNKKTQHHIGLLKAKIAKLKEKEASKGGGSGEGYSVRKSGDVTAVLLGFPSVGKSTILNSLTNAESEIAEYDFTTLDVIPGMMEYNHAKIQILDIPGIVHGAASGKGRGKEVLSVIRNADLIVMVIDALQPQQHEALKKEIYDADVRINQKRPDVKIKKKAKDGVDIGSTVPLDFDEDTIKRILKEFRIMNADVLIRDKITMDQFIDCLENNKSYIPAITVVNKVDLLKDTSSVDRLNPDLKICAKSGQGIEQFKKLIYDNLDLINIYLKEPGKKADKEEPMVIRYGSTIGDLCRSIHKDFARRFRYARVWGRSAKFPGQRLKRKDHKLHDKDIIEIHTS